MHSQKLVCCINAWKEIEDREAGGTLLIQCRQQCGGVFIPCALLHPPCQHFEFLKCSRGVNPRLAHHNHRSSSRTHTKPMKVLQDSASELLCALMAVRSSLCSSACASLVCSLRLTFHPPPYSPFSLQAHTRSLRPLLHLFLMLGSLAATTAQAAAPPAAAADSAGAAPAASRAACHPAHAIALHSSSAVAESASAASFPMAPAADRSMSSVAVLAPLFYAPTLQRPAEAAHLSLFHAPTSLPPSAAATSSPSSLIAVPLSSSSSSSQPIPAADLEAARLEGVRRRMLQRPGAIRFNPRGTAEDCSSGSSSCSTSPLRRQGIGWSEQMKQRISKGASSFPALPPPQPQRQVVIVCRGNDAATAEISADSDDRAYEGIYKLLNDNKALMLAGAHAKTSAKDKGQQRERCSLLSAASFAAL